MATETQVLTNLTPNIKGCFVRLASQMCFFNGYDKPRYFDRQGRAGYLGLEDWSDSSYTPTGAASAGGGLTENLYFSCVAVPVDTRYPDNLGNYRRGNPTSAATAVQTTAANRTITWTVPLAHPQTSLNVYSPAYLTGDTGAQSIPATWAAVTNGEFAITIDGVARNITGIDFTGDATMADVAATIQARVRAVTGSFETVTWSTNHFIISSVDTTSASAITVTSAVSGGSGTDISGAGGSDWMDADAGNGVVTAAGFDKEANQIWLYCSQGSPTAQLAQDGQKYFIGIISSNTAGQTLAMTSDPSTSANAVELDNYQPPTIRFATAMQDRIFGIVGITETRGQMKWDSANSRFQGRTYGAYTISGIASQGNDIWRVSFSGSPDLSSITVNMRLSISGCSVAGNNINLAIITAISDASDYIDIRNPSGSASGTFGTATVYSTYISDGMSGYKFRFENDGVNQIYTIDAVTVNSQYFTVEESGYNGAKTADTYYDFLIETSDRKLWFSKPDDPNSWPTENTVNFEEDLTAVSPAGEYLAVFSRNSIYTVNPRDPADFRKTQAPVGTFAPFSVVHTENGVYFFDGRTIRLFNGLQAPDAARRKVRVIMEGINETIADRVHAVFLPHEQSIRWYIPYGDDTSTNNYYVQYNVNTGFWWIGRCIDITTAVVLTDESTGEQSLFTGTSARYADKGYLLQNDTQETDGNDAATTQVFGTVSAIAGSQIIFTVASGAVSTNEVGTPFNVFAPSGTRDIVGIIKTIVDNGGGSYTITAHSDFDLSTVQTGDWISIGLATFRWGVKWHDFGSPQFKHELKEIHLHFTPADYIYGIVDFYTDFATTPDKSVPFTITTGNTKAVVRNHGKRGYQVGFRIRMWSEDPTEIRDMMIIHKTIA